MPNECINTLGIMGKKENVEEFIKFVTTESNEVSIFNSLMPFPEELGDTASPLLFSEKGKNKELVAKYGSDNWYDWRIYNWGTKWGDYEITTSEMMQSKEYRMDSAVVLNEEWYIHFYYTTAWAPGEKELANAICKIFPKLKAMIQYEEPGMAFAGETLISNGKIVRQDMWELNTVADGINDVYWLQYEPESK